MTDYTRSKMADVLAAVANGDPDATTELARRDDPAAHSTGLEAGAREYDARFGRTSSAS